MPMQKYLNNFDWQFIAPVLASTHVGFEASLGRGVLQISDAAGVLLGSLTGGDWYILTAFKRSGSVESSIEIVKVLGVNEVGYAVPGECRIRVERGAEGTTPQAYVAGDLISMRLTAGGAGLWLQNGSVTKSTVGLANVDNTSDLNKPVSTATQTALNAKQDTLVSGTNIKTINGNSLTGSGNLVLGGAGTVTSVAATVPAFLSVSGSPITSSGTIAITYSGTALPVANGGTGATTAADARTALGLVIGTNVQAQNASLQSIAGQTVVADRMLYTTGVDTYALATLSAAGRALIDDPDVNSQRATLGLGTAATMTGPAGAMVGTTDTQTLTNKTLALGSNTVSGTLAQFNTAVTDADLVSLAGTETLTNKTITAVSLRETRVAMGASNIDLATGNLFTRTISGATTLTVSNVPATGTAASFILDLTNGGSGAITWWSGMKWAGGTAPTLTAAGRDVLGFFTHDGGTTWTGLLMGKDVK